jgi:Tfp pilus assembly protein PilF
VEAPAAAPVSNPGRRIEWWIYAALLVAVGMVYFQVRHFDFVNFDDPEYLAGNNHVRAGMTWAGLKWAFTSTAASNWFPLTWISHMAAYRLFGLASGWHHLLNVLIHALASLLLLAALRRMTGALWPSAFVAFVFALHPLHVESVAWVAERKDVLCAFFWCLTMWCYARYAERPSKRAYAWVVLAFCGGLMSKSMIVTLPAVLLLLDFWPLRRSWQRTLLWEKAPLVALAGGVSLLTLFSQSQAHAVRSLASLPFGLRVENAAWTYVLYIGRMFWPGGLAVYYPYVHEIPAWHLLLAVIVLAGVTYATVRRWRQCTYLAVGWFWYLGSLLPVIGLVQVGGQASADRYTYLPSIGLTIMLAWSADDLLRKYPQARRTVAAVAASSVCVCGILAAIQTSYWQNSGTLFRHAVDVTTDNYIAENNLADYYLTQNRTAEARTPVLEALRMNPNYPEAHVNLATILRRTGQTAESEHQYREAIQLQPINANAHAGYGALLLQEGRLGEAAGEFAQAVDLQPENAEGHYDLGRVLVTIGSFDRGVQQLKEAVRLRPDYAEAHHALALAFAGRGRLDDAIAEFRAEARVNPDDAALHNSLGMLLAGVGRLDEAIAEYAEALRLQPNLQSARRGLDAAESKKNAAH